MTGRAPGVDRTRQILRATLQCDKFNDQYFLNVNPTIDGDIDSQFHQFEHGQVPVVVPNVSMKELLDVIPAHCFERSALRSSLYAYVPPLSSPHIHLINPFPPTSIWDFLVILAIYKITLLLESAIPSLPYPSLHGFAWVALWAVYSFWVGLFGMGLWVVAHECGHQAFSKSKALNNAVGWVLHSSLGVPYHAWRISHAKHHAATCHMTQDQVFVPWTRKEVGAPAFNPSGEDLLGSTVSHDVKRELWEALGDTPIIAFGQCVVYLVLGLPLYLVYNTAGQPRYPKGTNHFLPSSIIFAPHQRGQIVWSDFGIFLWLAAIVASCQYWSFAVVFRVYLLPYIWVNHWLVLITFLQHTDPLIPHYRADVFTFQRGALSTLDRSLLGDLGSVMGWIAAHATNGISETHVLHHVTSKIPHYHAWEAAAALRKKLEAEGVYRQGAPGGWREAERNANSASPTVPQFVEDEGSVVFYKNAYGVAAARPVFQGAEDEADSGVELDK
ncbi:Delta(12) fatty acid desaturase [Hypsizygus marmoreus]|uniref:Delta(12) fatty acid desaturase n=1 Tax=Hypsizygus marmoreus TaxID=39966 RepID=A0A369K483_HYPMA|nr:Delta(12) fatty acid desaturase [Hypsizygus marmoreus]